MPKVVYKYLVPDNRGEGIDMPTGAKVVQVGLQRDNLMLWAEHGKIDTTTTYTARRFDVFGTGHEIPEGAEYVGTFFDGPFVLHVYEVPA